MSSPKYRLLGDRTVAEIVVTLTGTGRETKASARGRLHATVITKWRYAAEYQGSVKSRTESRQVYEANFR